MSVTTRIDFILQIARNGLGRFVAFVVLLTPVLLISACGVATINSGSGGSGSQGNTSPVTVAVTPKTPTLSIGASQTFAATVTKATNTAISWSVSEGASGGSITSDGVYTAPMKAGSYHVKAASVADTTASSIATVTVTAPAPTITSTAPTAANEGDVFSYAPTATDSANTAVTFSLVSGPDGATLSNNTLTWTPTHAQSRVANSFDIRATTGAGGTADQVFLVIPSGTIRGTAVDTHVTATGNVASVEDLTKKYIAVEYLSGNTWITVEGTGNTDGTFEIPGIPAGNYWIAIDSGGYWVFANDLDLGRDYRGRKDGISPSSEAILSLALDGLASWVASDTLDIFNPNLSQEFDWSDDVGTNASSVAALWNWTGPLSDASRGDAWYATQMLTQTIVSTKWRYAAKATPAISITQTNGSTTQLNGTLVNASQLTVRLKTLGSQFTALASAVGVNASIHSTSLGIYSQPFTSFKGLIGDAAILLARDGEDPITTNTDFGNISFGNPFPTSWTPFVNLSYELSVPLTATGASSQVDVPAEIYINTTILPTSNSPLAPVITPVRNVKLNGSGLTQELNSTTLSPTLSWDAPATGTPTGYRVSVYQLSKTGSASSYQFVLDLYTKANSMTIPAGVLAAGKEYFFGIRSYLVPTVDFTSTPYRAAFPWAHTDMITAVVSTNGATQNVLKVKQSAIEHIVKATANPLAMRAGGMKQPAVRSIQRPKVN
jgi:hypothetical protein